MLIGSMLTPGKLSNILDNNREILSNIIDRNVAFLSGISDTGECARVEVAAGRLDGRGRAGMFGKGIRIEDMDLLIAATAIYNDMTLVTNNTKHFEHILDLKLENWKRP